MATTSKQQFDDTGKVVFDDVYVQPDPRPYFTAQLREYDYRIAGEAKPVFRQTIDALRRERGISKLDIVDIGCSYGINAALLKTDLTVDDLNEHYGEDNVGGMTRAELVEYDRRFYDEHERDPNLDFMGIDASDPAARYAEDAGLLKVGISTNLEEEKLAGSEREAVSEADLVISTGAIGYVTERTIGQVMDAAGDRKPWMAHCVLRMFSFDPMEAMLRDRGYVVEQLEGTLLQRRFANEEEQQHALDNLAELGIDPSGKESEGWYHANVFIARPKGETSATFTTV